MVVLFFLCGFNRVYRFSLFASSSLHTHTHTKRQTHIANDASCYSPAVFASHETVAENLLRAFVLIALIGCLFSAVGCAMLRMCLCERTDMPYKYVIASADVDGIAGPLVAVICWKKFVFRHACFSIFQWTVIEIKWCSSFIHSIPLCLFPAFFIRNETDWWHAYVIGIIDKNTQL